MNALVNSVRLMGNLGKAPIIKSFSNGGKIANCTIATAHISKDKEGNKIEETDWHNIVIKGKLAEVVEKYVSKGSKIAVEGSLRNRKYTDAAGNDKYITEVIVNDLQLLSKKESQD